MDNKIHLCITCSQSSKTCPIEPVGQVLTCKQYKPKGPLVDTTKNKIK